MRQTNIITFRQFYKQKYLEMAEIFDRQQAVTPQQQAVTPPPNPMPYPEFSSLTDFLNKENYPTYFG